MPSGDLRRPMVGCDFRRRFFISRCGTLESRLANAELCGGVSRDGVGPDVGFLGVARAVDCFRGRDCGTFFAGEDLFAGGGGGVGGGVGFRIFCGAGVDETDRTD